MTCVEVKYLPRPPEQQTQVRSANHFASGRSMPATLMIGPSSIHGFGLIARCPISKGSRIARLEGTLVRNVPTNTYPNAIGIGRAAWIDPGVPFSFINHSCAPTSAFGRRRYNYALCDIDVGDEVTVDYSTTEVDPEWSLPCHCSAASCRHILRAAQFAFSDRNQEPVASPLILRIWKSLVLQ